jgi:drug/metabolite transporter (DMT)-like permease
MNDAAQGAPESTKAVLAAMAGAALIAFAPILVRLSELGPQATTFWRFALALPILAVAAGIRLRMGGGPPSMRESGLIFVAGALFGMDIALWSAALAFTTIANATLLSNMTPIFAAAAGWLLFKERLNAGVTLGAAVGLAGAVTLALARAHPTAEDAANGWFGDALALFSALWYAGYLLIVRAMGARVRLAWLMLIASAGACALAFVATIVMGESFWPATWRGWLILLALGVLVQIGGQGLIAYGVARLPIAISTVLLWVQPVAAAALSWVIFNEALGPWAFVGAAMVLGGVWVVQRSRTNPAKAAANVDADR